MIINDSLVENADLERVRKLGYAVGHGTQLTPGEPAAERNSFGEVVLAGRFHEALRRLNTAHQSRTLAITRDMLPSKLPSGKVLVAGREAKPAGTIAKSATIQTRRSKP